MWKPEMVKVIKVEAQGSTFASFTTLIFSSNDFIPVELL